MKYRGAGKMPLFYTLQEQIMLSSWLLQSGLGAVADPGEGPGGAWPPLFLDQNEAWKAGKNFLRPPPPLSQGLDDWAPHLSEGNCFNFFFNSTWHGNQNYPPVYLVNILLILMICIQGSK